MTLFKRKTSKRSDWIIPPEKEGKQGTSEIQPLIPIVISIIELPTAQSSQQQPMYHVPR
jgi:hypothetical protein